MQKIFTLTLSFYVLLLFMTCKQSNETEHMTHKEEISTFYFIRHAEKDRSDKTNHDPHLTEIGTERAQHWSQVLQHIKFDAVYITDYYRTRETANPTAKANHLELKIYDGKKLDAEKLKKDNFSKTVLIVGHSDTTPALVNKFIDKEKYTAIDDSNNGNLYIVTISKNTVTDQLLEINPR